jgi:hypothetical protein
VSCLKKDRYFEFELAVEQASYWTEKNQNDIHKKTFLLQRYQIERTSVSCRMSKAIYNFLLMPLLYMFLAILFLRRVFLRS